MTGWKLREGDTNEQSGAFVCHCYSPEEWVMCGDSRCQRRTESGTELTQDRVGLGIPEPPVGQPPPDVPSGAIEKAVALMTSVAGRPMTAPCKVCRGGWWFEGDVCISGVHASECPYSGTEPTREGCVHAA